MHDAHCQESMCLLEGEVAEHANKYHRGNFLTGHQWTWVGEITVLGIFFKVLRSLKLLEIGIIMVSFSYGSGSLVQRSKIHRAGKGT